MGVDPEDVMSIGEDLLEQYPDAFSGAFGENKHLVGRFAELRSRRVRNRVAGYITRQQTDEG